MYNKSLNQVKNKKREILV